MPILPSPLDPINEGLDALRQSVQFESTMDEKRAERAAKEADLMRQQAQRDAIAEEVLKSPGIFRSPETAAAIAKQDPGVAMKLLKREITPGEGLEMSKMRYAEMAVKIGAQIVDEKNQLKQLMDKGASPEEVNANRNKIATMGQQGALYSILGGIAYSYDAVGSMGFIGKNLTEAAQTEIVSNASQEISKLNKEIANVFNPEELQKAVFENGTVIGSAAMQTLTRMNSSYLKGGGNQNMIGYLVQDIKASTTEQLEDAIREAGTLTLSMRNQQGEIVPDKTTGVPVTVETPLTPMQQIYAAAELTNRYIQRTAKNGGAVSTRDKKDEANTIKNMMMLFGQGAQQKESTGETRLKQGAANAPPPSTRVSKTQEPEDMRKVAAPSARTVTKADVKRAQAIAREIKAGKRVSANDRAFASRISESLD
ncbi:MAG: hypothetical protein UY96_C0032G0006 [Parcubacteria group bacterium GW2011_GWB1_56_8]|nr:MAG: hypothetical protein UY96_C0032G0006 [Parcubacteria group bacterium GW2011_GWB1_56_8]